MARHKAKGLDQLQDYWFLQDEVWKVIKDKLLNDFNVMIQKQEVPLYWNKSQIVCLSKDKDNEG